MLNKKKNFRYILIGILGGCGILISGRRNGGEKMYQIPKGNVAINETVYTFYKPFLEQYGIKIDTEAVKQMINCLETEAMQEGLEVQQWIYENDLDAHIELYDKNIQARAVFQITNIPTIEELKGEYESGWLEVPLGNRNVAGSAGN